MRPLHPIHPCGHGRRLLRRLDGRHLCATSFMLTFSDSGSTRQLWPLAAVDLEVM
jgi:hypothetical protein